MSQITDGSIGVRSLPNLRIYNRLLCVMLAFTVKEHTDTGDHLISQPCYHDEFLEKILLVVRTFHQIDEHRAKSVDLLVTHHGRQSKDSLSEKCRPLLIHFLISPNHGWYRFLRLAKNKKNSPIVDCGKTSSSAVNQLVSFQESCIEGLPFRRSFTLLDQDGIQPFPLCG